MSGLPFGRATAGDWSARSLADLPLTARQRALCASILLLFEPYRDARLATPGGGTVPRLDLSLSCRGFGEPLTLTAKLRERDGWAPDALPCWTGRERVFVWGCTPAGRARWVGAAPAVALRASAQ